MRNRTAIIGAEVVLLGSGGMAEALGFSLPLWVWCLIVVVGALLFFASWFQPPTDRQSNGYRVARRILHAWTMKKAERLYQDFSSEPNRTGNMEVFAAYGLRHWRTRTGDGGWMRAAAEDKAVELGAGSREDYNNTIRRLERENPERLWLKWRNKLCGDRLHSTHDEKWLEDQLPKRYRAILNFGRWDLVKDAPTSGGTYTDIRTSIKTRREVLKLARLHAAGKRLPYQYSAAYWEDIKQGKSCLWARFIGFLRLGI